MLIIHENCGPSLITDWTPKVLSCIILNFIGVDNGDRWILHLGGVLRYALQLKPLSI